MSTTRCIARTLATGAPALADHPKTVNLCESHIIRPLNAWLSGLFNRTNPARTVEMLVEAQNHGDGNHRRAMLRAEISAAEIKLTRHRTAIEAGVDPLALVEAMNAARSAPE